MPLFSTRTCHYITRRLVAAYSPFNSKPDNKDIEKYIFWRKKIANRMANQYQPERILAMGPDLACMEWLMNAGATSIKLSNGMVIKTQAEMRQFLADQGYDTKNLKTEAPEAQIVKDFAAERKLDAKLYSDIAYQQRWPNISPIHMKEVDATDAVITDQGFKYFRECRNIEKLLLNFNDYFGDDGLRELSNGRPAKTLKEMEICFNQWVTDGCSHILGRFQALQRLHMYFLTGVQKKDAVRRQLRHSLPKCKVTFPPLFFIGMGYETEAEKAAYREANADIEKTNPFIRWLNQEELIPEFMRFGRKVSPK